MKRRTPAALLCCASCALAAHAGQTGTVQPTEIQAAPRLPGVVVIGTTPLAGLGVPLDQVPSGVQTASGKSLEHQHTLTLEDYLDNNFSGVNVNQTQSNPFQPDVVYHGFRASPLLGAPQGLSVYEDGVRLNEPFGGTVNWDLVPESAIRQVQLISGSDPVYGLNTLGGALSIQTKSGRSNPGTQMQISGGSFGRGDAQAQTGGTFGHFAGGNFDYFVTANYFHQDGWRDRSPSLVRQIFAKAGWQGGNTSVHLSYTWANNNLIGNGVVPSDLLAKDYKSIYTSPDQTLNTMHFLNLTGTHSFSDTLLVSGNAFYRNLQKHTQNGDDNDDFDNDDFQTITGTTASCPGQLPFPASAGVPPAALNDAVADCAHGVNHASRLSERIVGSGVQLSDTHPVFGWQNQATVGIDFYSSLNGFSQNQQFGNLDAQRSFEPYPGAAVDIVNDLSGRSQIYGGYLTNTLSPTRWLHVTASARYNWDQEKLNGYSVDDGTRLPVTVDHSFHRLNPALGFTLTPPHTLSFYGDYNEGARAPTVIELGCADPDNPCALPNDFASDPPLHQIVARTFEVGARGSLYGHYLGWSVDLYHTRLSHDIELVATSKSAGFFHNVGDTRRQGADLGLHGTVGKLTWGVVYGFLDATYRSSFQQVSGANTSCVGPDDDSCLMTIHRGDRIPLIPRQTGRLILDYAITPKWNAGINLIASSGEFLTGNENNANVAGGTTGAGDTIDGSGRIGGYAIVNLHTNYRVAPNVDLFMRVNNLLNRQYATGGFLTDDTFDANGHFTASGGASQNFVAPGAPIGAWLGVRARF
ncbi:MAG TPA: TonB-dependent receptor [Nevskiaceae bacterium]|nr:TonB-dependent receptor [Nevskiaceae bacterium]